MICFACPHCQASILAHDEGIGHGTTCENCQQRVVIPDPTLDGVARHPLPRVTKRRPSRRFTDIGNGYLLALGTAGLFVSITITLFHWAMDTAVGTVGSDLVHNAGKMNDRIVGVIIGVGWTIASLMILGASLRARKK